MAAKLVTPEQWPHFERLVQEIARGARLIQVQVMTGGVSAAVHLLEYETTDGSIARCVVRRHSDSERRHHPHIAADEYRLLTLLYAEGLPVARPLAVVGIDLLLSWIDGSNDYVRLDWPQAVDQMAALLVRIHLLSGVTERFDFLPDQFERVRSLFDVAVPDATTARLKRALRHLRPRNSAHLLHGDYWPGNTLWQGQALAAVIDWEDAALGDPLSDLANARLEMLWAYGPDAVQRFTDQYHSHMPQLDYSLLPYWDCWVALRPLTAISGWGLSADDEARMRDQLGWFSSQALSAAGL